MDTIAMAQHDFAKNLEEAWGIERRLNTYPLRVTPAFTLHGDRDQVVVESIDDFARIVEKCLNLSPEHEVCIERYRSAR